MTELVKIVISKNDRKSKVLGETISAYLDDKNVDAYLQLIRKTWPTTKVRITK